MKVQGSENHPKVERVHQRLAEKRRFERIGSGGHECASGGLHSHLGGSIAHSQGSDISQSGACRGGKRDGKISQCWWNG